MPALLKCDVGTFALDAILDVLLSIIFALFSGCFLHVFVLPVLACTRAAITSFSQFFRFFTYGVLAFAIFLALAILLAFAIFLSLASR